MWKLLATIIILYLLWRVLEKPKRVITRVPPATPNSGDTFANGTPTIAAGVGEPCTGGIFAVPTHVLLPISAPPPIAIQQPVTASVPTAPRIYNPPAPKTPTVSGTPVVRPVAPIRYPTASMVPSFSYQASATPPQPPQIPGVPSTSYYLPKANTWSSLRPNPIPQGVPEGFAGSQALVCGATV